jgi:nucleoside-diphosphate-sugar epimerase
VRIAVAGGTSQLAKDVVAELRKNGYTCYVFSRRPGKDHLPYAQLWDTNFDAYLNLIGGYKTIVNQEDLDMAFMIGQRMATIATEVNAPLVHLSSGSVLQNDTHPLRSESPLASHPFQNPYQALKVKFEQLHRSMRDKAPITDLRLFSYAGSSAIERGNYFLSKLSRSIIREEIFKLDGPSFIRDYSSPQEISSAIATCLKEKLSVSANLFTSKSVSREEILQYCQDYWGLRISADKGTIEKPHVYCSVSEFYLPNFRPLTSMMNVKSALTSILGE